MKINLNQEDILNILKGTTLSSAKRVIKQQEEKYHNYNILNVSYDTEDAYVEVSIGEGWIIYNNKYNDFSGYGCGTKTELAKKIAVQVYNRMQQSDMKKVFESCK